MPTAPIRNVSDTARWVAFYRAMESERPDAIFSDPFARRLAGERGEEIVRTLPAGVQTAWAMITRTAVIDEIVLRQVREGGVRTVVNLAAGLDTRPFRLPLDREVRWLHVDLPDQVAYVQEQLAGETPRCRLEFVAADLTEPAARRATFAKAGEGGGPALALSEGLLIYLDSTQVAEIARDLAAVPAIRSWVIDLASPKMLAMLERRWQPHLRAGNAPFKFAPPEGTAFFEPLGWKETEFRSFWSEATRLKRAMRGAWIWNLLMKITPERRRREMLRMSGIVLLARSG